MQFCYQYKLLSVYKMYGSHLRLNKDVIVIKVWYQSVNFFFFFLKYANIDIYENYHDIGFV